MKGVLGARTGPLRAGFIGCSVRLALLPQEKIHMLQLNLGACLQWCPSRNALSFLKKSRSFYFLGEKKLSTIPNISLFFNFFQKRKFVWGTESEACFQMILKSLTNAEQLKEGYYCSRVLKCFSSPHHAKQKCRLCWRDS